MNEPIAFFGVVIVYNPDKDVIDNINTYIDSLECLYIYDNSSTNNLELFNSLDNSRYIYLYNGKNEGISKALNEVCYELYDKGNAWLLTMDQDSKFKGDEIKKLLDMKSYDLNDVGIISPLHQTALEKPKNTNGIISRLTVMTSGNLLNVSKHKLINGFDERYFIDCVDWEYCLKLNKNGFKVLQNNDILLSHGLGEPIEVINKLTGRKKVVLNHSPLRRYYITRNKLLISRQYIFTYPKRVCKYLFEVFYSDIVSILFYETEKNKKLRYYTLGIKDYIISKFGIYDS